MSVDIQELITCAAFGDDRLRGVGVARGRISNFPIACVVALTTLSHLRVSDIHYVQETKQKTSTLQLPRISSFNVNQFG